MHLLGTDTKNPNSWFPGIETQLDASSSQRYKTVNNEKIIQVISKITSQYTASGTVMESLQKTMIYAQRAIKGTEN